MPEITELKITLTTSKAGVEALKALDEASSAAAASLKEVNTQTELSVLLLRAQAEQARDSAAAAKALGAANVAETKALAEAYKVANLGNAYARLAVMRAGAIAGVGTGPGVATKAGDKYIAYASDEQRQNNLDGAGKEAADAKAKAAAAPAEPKRKYSEAEWKEAGDFATELGKKLEHAFGGVGTTIGKMTTGLLNFRKAQDDIDFNLAKDLAAAKSTDDKTKAQDKAHMAGVKQYKELAGAAKGFFKEHTTGYEVMEKVEKGFRAYEFAMNAKALFEKLTNITVVTTAKTAATTAEIAGAATAVAPVAAAEAAKSSAYGTTALASALATPFPASIGAYAMVAGMLMAIGVAVSGGGGADTTAKDRQAANGTGTVLGDSSAKSESIANSLSIMEKNSGLGLAYSSSMVVSLKQIVSGIGGLGSLLVRSDTLTATLATKGSASGGMLGNIGNSIFGGKTSVIDTGIVTSQSTLGELDKSGIAVNAYVDTKKSGGWFSSDKYRTALSSLGSETGDQFTKIILGLRATIVAASDTLGLGGDAFAARLNTFVVNLGKISLKDLKGEELQKALEAAFSKLGDDMAKFGVGGLEKYQQVGEGYLETLARVANNYMQVSDVLAVLGKSFQVTGLGAVALSENLIAAAGDLDALTSGTGFFVDNFLTEAERMAPITRSVNDAMGKLGLGGVTTMDGFKAAVLNAADGVALGKDGAAQLYAGLLALAEPFKTAAEYAADLAAATGDYAAVTKTAAEIASERKDLQSQLEQLTLSAMQLRAKEREALDAGNRALFDQVAARQDLASAYETESTAISGTIDKLKTFAGELTTFRNGLALGALSPLSPTAKAAEAQRQYREMLGKASAGDAAAQSGLTGAASAYLTASQAASGTAGQYARDHARVQADMAIMAASVGSQVTAAEAQQLALDKQVAGLVKLNDSVNAGAATVAQAIATLGMLGVTQIVGTAISAGEGAHTALEPRNFAAQASLGNEALVNEIKGLREDNRALKEELTSFKVQSQTENVAIVQSVGKLSRLADRWDADGMPTRELA
jgi:hypothetical protein